MKILWKVREPKIQSHETDFITDKILKARGIEDTYSFLNPSSYSLNSPELMKNMSLLVEKIMDYIFEDKKIAIYADVDTDGVTSTVVLYRYLKNFTDNIEIIYHQRNDGHGVLSKNCIGKGFDVIIAVDSSTNSTEECKIIVENGMEVLVLDHHLKECENPYATIVNPQLCNYPNKELSGVGVVFQFCRAFDNVMNTEYAFQYIDLVAVGMLGDMMNVTSPETRYIIYEGLNKIRSMEKNLGIKTALSTLNKWYKPNATDIVFSLVPMINSTIRMGHIEWALELFSSDDELIVKEMSKKCNSFNKKRKKDQKLIVDSLEVDNSNSIIILDATENKIESAMRGLIANNIANAYQKPCLVVSNEDGVLSGSARSYGNILNFKDILNETELFDNLIGHQAAFGVEFKIQNKEQINKELNKTLSKTDKTLTLEADMEIDFKDITWQFVQDLEPLYFLCGQGFEPPTFIIRNMKYSDYKIMGDFGEHIKLSSNEDLEIVHFNGDKEIIGGLTEYKFNHTIGKLSVNSWYHNGRKEMVHTMQIMADNFK